MTLATTSGPSRIFLTLGCGRGNVIGLANLLATSPDGKPESVGYEQLPRAASAARVSLPANKCPYRSYNRNRHEWNAAERMEELAGGATLRDAGTTAGIATEKLLALLGETGGGVPVQINMYTGVAELLHKRYNDLVRRMESGAGAESKQSLPNGETDLQSGKELPKAR